MSAGTIKLTNGSTAVVGTGTAFTSDLKSGDVITATVGGIFFTLFVDAVTSNTALTLTDPFTGPTTSGLAWVAVPQLTLNRITAALAAQTAESVRRVLQENANWQAFYTGTGDITVTLPDGTPAGRPVTGPSWTKMAGLNSSALQWRGSIPASSNINNFGPTSAYTGYWGQSTASATAADVANGYPVADSGILEVFAGGAFGGTQIYTTSGGREFIRRLAAAWNASNPQWSDWVEMGGLSSNTVLPSTVTTLSDATAFAQNKTYVLSGARTDSPVGVTATTAIIMSVRRAGNTTMGLHQMLFTAVGTYERYGAPNAATGWTSVSWYNGGDANGWRLVGADAMAAIGLGVANQGAAAAFDWQQADFYSGQTQLANVTGWLNAPAELKNPAGDIVAIDCLIARTTSNRFVVRITSQSPTAVYRYDHTVVIVGAKGSRTFTVSQNFNSDPSTVVPIANGGTGSSTVAGAQTNLQLVKQVGNTDQAAGRLLTVGAFGSGAKAPVKIGQDNRLGGGFFISEMALGGVGNNVSLAMLPLDDNTMYQMVVPAIIASAPKLYLRLLSSTAQYNGQLCEVYTTANTTKAADGTLKAASPIVQIFHDGDGVTNDESEGCTVKRLGVGEYLIEGCIGLNADASWGGVDGGFDIPKDRNRQPLVWLDYEVNADGSVLVKTYHRTHPGAPVFARNEREGFAEGDPIDIPADQFVSVRVEMPADSIYNKKLEEAARIQAERDEARRLEEEEAARVKAEQERQEAEAEAASNSDIQPDVQQ